MSARFHRALLFTAIVCPAALFAQTQTLGQLLEQHRVPAASFPADELSTPVSGVSQEDPARLVIAYTRMHPDRSPFGRPYALRFEKSTGAVEHRELQMSEDDVCNSALEDLAFVDSFSIVSVHVSPDAGCLLVVDSKLLLRTILYGFDATRIAPNQIVLIESMIHFSAAHPERLQFADLTTGKTEELYPAKGDALRDKLITLHEQRLPSQSTCAVFNDPCEPEVFDEDIGSVGTNGKGKLAFVATQEPAHRLKEGEPAVTVASQTVLYVYEKRSDGWFYCERELDKAAAEELDKKLSSAFNDVASRCSPDLAVVPDMSTAQFNPFFVLGKK